MYVLLKCLTGLILRKTFSIAIVELASFVDDLSQKRSRQFKLGLHIFFVLQHPSTPKP